MKYLTHIALSASTLMLSHAVNADTLYVSKSGSAGTYSTIQAAITAASAGDTIEVEPGRYGSINLVSKDLTFRSSSTTDKVEVDGSGTRRAMACSWVSSETSFTMFRFQDGDAGYSGYGGGVNLYQASPVFDSCDFEDNFAGRGGGVSADVRSSPLFKDCNFRRNSADMSGGAAYGYRVSQLKFQNCTFEENDALSSGGAIYLYRADLECDGGTFIDSDATSGGVVYATDQCELRFTESTFSDNWAVRHGGSISIVGRCLLEITDSQFENAQAEYGGHIFVSSNSVFRAANSTFDDGFAYRSGGHVYADLESTVSLEGNVLTRGIATWGGSLYLREGRYEGWDNEFGDSTASIGAMIYSAINEVAIDGSTFENALSIGRTSERDGRAMYFSDSALFCNNAVFQGMETTADSAMQSLILHRGGQAEYASCEFIENVLGKASRASSIVRLDNGSDGLFQSCSFQDNYGVSATSVIRNVSSTLEVDASLFETNGKSSSSGPLGFSFAHAVVHTAGRSATTQIGSSSFCGNSVRDTSGTWSDLGGNSFSSTCP